MNDGVIDNELRKLFMNKSEKNEIDEIN